MNPELWNGRYYFNAPERKNHCELGENYGLEQKRLLNGNLKIANDEDLKEAYWKTIKFQEEHGIIEDAPEESAILHTY